MTTWTFIWLMFLLKIPIVGLFLIVRWAVRDAPESQSPSNGDGGIRPRPRHPHRPRRPTHRPRLRGPHGEPVPSSPPRLRTMARSSRRLPRV